MELVALCDISTGTVDSLSKEHGVNGYLNLEDMLENEELDLVAICSPSGLHPEQTASIARHGIHVMTEKPMATRMSDGISMVRECDNAKVRLFVVKQNRRNTTLQLLKRAIDEKRFGKIYMVHLNVFWTRPQEYYDMAKWRGTW